MSENKDHPREEKKDPYIYIYIYIYIYSSPREGQKIYISGGPVADQVVVFAKTDYPDPKSLNAFVVDTTMPGFEVTSIDSIVGQCFGPKVNFEVNFDLTRKFKVNF